MKYKIISGSKQNDVELEVNEYLEKGWELYGDLCVTSVIDYETIVNHFVQTLVFLDEADKEEFESTVYIGGYQPVIGGSGWPFGSGNN